MHVDAQWPLQAWSSTARGSTSYHRASVCDTRHLVQGVDTHGALLRVPQTVIDKHHVSISTSEVNPDNDAAGTGSTQLLLHASGDAMGVHDPSGHFMGHLALRRLYHLEQRYAARHQRLPSSADRTIKMPPDAVYQLLAAHGVHKARHPSGGKQSRMRRWLPTDSVVSALRAAVPFDQEWFSSSLTVSEGCSLYASRIQQDAEFGAVVDAFSYQWTGKGLINIPPSSVDKALRWAVQSTTAKEPVLHVAIVPMVAKVSETLQRHQDSGRLHVLCCIKAHSIDSELTECWLNSSPQPCTNECQLSVALIYNQPGLEQFDRTGLDGLRSTLSAAGAGIQSWSDDIPRTVGSGPPPKRSAAFGKAQPPPAMPVHMDGAFTVPDDNRLADYYSGHATHTPDACYAQATCIYTDGSKVDTTITGGVYQQAQHGVPLNQQAFLIQGHDPELNTVLRAELAAIDRAITQLRLTVPQDYPRRTAYILTDSLTSIQLLNKGLHDPEGLKTHKHRDLVFNIVQQLLSSPLDLRVVKVRAHTGVDGNEAATAWRRRLKRAERRHPRLMRRAVLAVTCTGSSTGRSHRISSRMSMSSCGTQKTSKTIC